MGLREACVTSIISGYHRQIKGTRGQKQWLALLSGPLLSITNYCSIFGTLKYILSLLIKPLSLSVDTMDY